MIANSGGHRQNEIARVVTDFRNARADYEMSRTSRFVRQRVGLAPQGGTADWHYRNEQAYYRDIEKARDMDRNDAIVGQTIDRAVNNIIQGGFTLDPKTGDAKLDRDLSQRWEEWACDPDQVDIEGESCFHELESLAMRSMLLDGDNVFLGLQAGQLQMFEAHQVQTTSRQKDTHLGVTRDRYGRHLRYWIMEDPIEPYQRKSVSRPVDVSSGDVRTLFHVYRPKRKSQHRGVTSFAPIFALTGMFEDIQFAKLVQQQVVSCFAVFRKQAAFGSTGGPPSLDPGYGASSTEETSEDEVRYIEGIAPGIMLTGKPGEDLQGFSPDVPNAEFFDHVRLMLQLIGVNIGLPLCLVLMDASDTNFSGWRGAVDEARRGFKGNQRAIKTRFHSPVYRWKLHQWMSEDRALRIASNKAKVNIFGHKWNEPHWPYIQPIDDAQGDVIRLQNVLTSPRRLQAERGRDWEEVARESIEDVSLAIVLAKREAQKLNKKFPDDSPVHWRELINLPTSTGAQMVIDTESGDRSDDGGGDGAQRN